QGLGLTLRWTLPVGLTMTLSLLLVGNLMRTTGKIGSRQLHSTAPALTVGHLSRMSQPVLLSLAQMRTTGKIGLSRNPSPTFYRATRNSSNTIQRAPSPLQRIRTFGSMLSSRNRLLISFPGTASLNSMNLPAHYAGNLMKTSGKTPVPPYRLQ